MTETNSWLVVGSHLNPSYGGISGMLPSFCAAVKKEGECDLSLLSICEEEERGAWNPTSEISLTTLPPGKLRWLDSEWREHFRKSTSAVDGVHIHGLWEEHCMAASWSSREARTPYVISAHGMLEPWALNHKRWKKMLYGLLVENRNVSGAARLHALTTAEADHYRSFGARNPIAIVPNGVEIPENRSAAEFLNAFPTLKGKTLVLFLGRIHPKKGLDLLISSWSAISANFQDAHLVIAGPDSEGSIDRLTGRIQELQMETSVTFVGMLNKQMKWSALAASALFVLPSYSEGLSIAVLEAMGAGVPVIITHQCNMPEVAQEECGWTTEPDAKQLENALADALSQSPKALRAIGDKGRLLVEKRFNWEAVGNQMRSLYRWALGGEIPTNLEIRA